MSLKHHVKHMSNFWYIFCINLWKFWKSRKLIFGRFHFRRNHQNFIVFNSSQPRQGKVAPLEWLGLRWAPTLCKQKGWEKMRPRNRFAKFMILTVVILFLLQVTSCGTIIYPERRGQTGGRIDVGVAALDGIGVLLFIIPGLVAFIVDFATGAIYLPGGRRASATPSESDKMTVIQVDPDTLNKEKIEEIVSTRTGFSIKLDQENVQVFAVDGTENIEAKLLQFAMPARNAH